MISIVALIASGLTIYGMQQMTARLEKSLAAEQSAQRYSFLANHVSTFIIIATEAVQTEIAPENRAQRLQGSVADIRRNFGLIRSDLETQIVGQSAQNTEIRRANKSIAIARMEAQFNATALRLLDQSQTDRILLQGGIDQFSLGFSPLLNTAIAEELRVRNDAIASISTLRNWLTNFAFVIGGLAVLALIGFYFGIVRPQLARLVLLREAAQDVAQENFLITLPDSSEDEIGMLFQETNRMAAALAERKVDVENNWARLNETIDEKTEELRKANTALAKTDENRRRFFSDISHELRTPLTLILMESELGMKGDSPLAGSFEIIQNRALRLNRRIDDLLRIARSENGQLALESQSFDLCDVARAALEEARPEADSSGMSLELNLAGEIPMRGDINWVRQVITGLLHNAIRHARVGGALVLRGEEQDGFGIVRVIDNGAGVSVDDQKAVFDRFSQGEGGARSEGFGIGLALAKWVVEEHEGRIKLTSPVPDPFRCGDKIGTMVTVFFPIERG